MRTRIYHGAKVAGPLGGCWQGRGRAGQGSGLGVIDRNRPRRIWVA